MSTVYWLALFYYSKGERRICLSKKRKAIHPCSTNRIAFLSLLIWLSPTKYMKILHQAALKVKVNKAGKKYVHVKALCDCYCPHCHKRMIICGSKKRWFKVYLNRNHEDNAWDILELNQATEPGMDSYPDVDDITFELVLFTIPVFLCRDCQASRKDHPQHYHRGIVEDIMQTRLWHTIKTMCDTATQVPMPAELCSDGNDIFQTKRMIRRIIRFAHSAHVSNVKPFSLLTDLSGKKELIRVMREIVSARIKKLFK